MTGHVIHEYTIVDARPDTVWDVLTDLPRLADTLRSVKSVEADEGYDVGTTWREDRTFFGHHGTEELVVTECEHGRRTVQETTLRHDTIRTCWRLRPTAEGATKLMVTVTVDVSRRTPFEQFAWNTWGGLQFEATRRMIRQDLDDIRTEAERRDAHAGGKHLAAA